MCVCQNLLPKNTSVYVYIHHRRDPYKNKFSFQHGVCPPPCLLKADCIASSFHPSVMERKALADKAQIQLVRHMLCICIISN